MTHTYCVETSDGVCLGYWVARNEYTAKLMALKQHRRSGGGMGAHILQSEPLAWIRATEVR